ncbi:sensor histidine kinase [Paenibacillus alkalitolerans]|uniref:sensor histidine kinase n=1 Tax=Paenibacillus alkalitolerans TaxID=2799335 RepID=UPI0018F5E0CA|nr:HAMP domain-containing sensor histidine kinase [Paenibacillus alkalitolerans]
MKRKKIGIFWKVFLYTLSFLIAVIGLTALLFAQQFENIFEEGRNQFVTNNVRPLVEQLNGKSETEIKALAKVFHEQNIYLQFYIMKSDGELLYETPVLWFKYEGNDVQKQDVPNLNPGINNDEIMKIMPEYITFPLSNGMTLYVINLLTENDIDFSLAGKIVIALLVMLLISIFVSFVFARYITKPIVTLTEVTEKMSRMENVPIPKERNDEIGLLTNDVYKMYSSLKIEIERVKEIEENQRYFFSAASHELKTPVASAMVLLQGMLDNIGDYKDHSKYLRKCIDKMNTQSRIISEMLEIVRLADGKTPLQYESFNVRSIVESVLGSHQLLIDAKELSVTVDLPDSLVCHTDRNMLSRSLSNVIMNAVQNTPEKEKIQIWSEDRENHVVRLCVLNTGVHISVEILSKLFEPFFRVDKARSRSQSRSGLGLTIVGKTLELIQVAYSLENTPEGVLFWMELPNCNER